MVTVLDSEGAVLGNVEVTRVRAPQDADRALLVRVTAPAEIATRIAGIRVQEPWQAERRRALRAVDRRRRDRVPVRAGDGAGAAGS